MLPPRPLLAACLLLLGGLAWMVGGQETPHVAIADAARWEGQAVTLEGWAQTVRADAGGLVRLELVDAGGAVGVRVAGRPDDDLGDGERLAATGRLTRNGGSLVLMVDDPEDLRRVAAPASARPAWDEVASSPEAWTGRSLTLAGSVDHGHLVGNGHAVALGQGPWPRAGNVEATGLLRYEPSCLCHVLDAREVRPWTP